MAPARTKPIVVRQKAKGPIDPAFGTKVRALRDARGLTQAQLAGEDFSKGFISLVETGRTRVSLRAAEILANRLGVAVSELMKAPDSPSAAKLEVALAQIQKLLADQRPQDALRSLEEIERAARSAFRARWLRLRARALGELGRHREAVTLLDEAVRILRASGDRAATARALFELAKAHAGLDEQAEALNLALQVEALITDRSIVDRSFELQVLSFLAGILVNLGDLSAADLRTERAKALAEDVTDLRTVADLYYNLAVTRQEQGDGEGALAYARRSLDAFEQLEDRAAVASTWNTLAWIYMKRSQYARSTEALVRAEREATDAHYGALLPWIAQTRAELELARGRVARSVELADQSIADPNASARCRALSTLIRAQALARTRAGDPEVIRAFDSAAVVLRPFGRRQEARAYQAKFEALSSRNRLREANAAALRTLELLRPSVH